MPDPERPRAGVALDLKAVSRDIVDQAIEELGGARLSGPTRMLAQAVQRGLKRRPEHADVITDVDRLTGEISQVSAILQRCATALLTEEEKVALRSPGSDVWWNTRTRAVARALSLGLHALGLALLTASWVDGLEMDDWANCSKLLGLQGFPPEMETTLGRMRVVTDALVSGRYAAALDPLDGLLDTEGPAAHRIDQGAAVRLGVLRTRILDREFSDREMIRQSAEEAVVRAGDSDWTSLALAGLAETQLAADEVEAARDTLAKATRADRPCTDTLVATGLLSERDGFWALADQSYDRAVQGDPTATRAVLLRPVPPRLLVRAAVSSDVDVRDSLYLIDRALAEGIIGEDEFNPERDVYLARAEKLITLAEDDDEQGLANEALEHRAEAAASLIEAGHRYSSSGLLPQAVELFRRACDLAPGVAEFRWTYAEGLRLDASRADGTVDLEVLERARDQLERGLSLRPPVDTEAWVLVNHALIAEGLSDGDYDPALLVERALLKDPSYAAGYGFLAGVLRRQGFVQEAFEASSNGRATAGASDLVLFEQHLNLLMDRGEYDESLDLVEYQARRQLDDVELVPYHQADVLQRMQRPVDALSALSGQEPTDFVRLLRGHCLFAAGEVDASRAEFWSLWNDTRSGPAGNVAGWAAFRVGLLDEAISLYRDLRPRPPATVPYTRDLGQMLLVRGEVAEGSLLLAEGIAACPYVAELRQLATAEFEFVRHATADKRHGSEVEHALADLERMIDQRCTELLGTRRPDGSMAALLGAARVATHTGRPLDALGIYEKLADTEEVPEAVEAAMRAGRSARDAADVLFAEDDPAGARSQWSAAERAIVRMSADADPDLLQSLVCRRMLAGLQDKSQNDVAAWLRGVSGDSGLEREMTDAASKLAYDAAHLWALREGLLALRDRADVGADGRQLVVAAASQLPLSRVYHLDAVTALTPGSTFLFVNPLELRFGPAVEELCHSSELRSATLELQARIEAEMGVRIPWVYALGDPDLADRQVDVRVYTDWVGSTVLGLTPQTWIPQVMEKLEDRVRGYLFRLVGVDDVALWLEGWVPSADDAPPWEPIDPRADRLRLARVLRMLLREHASVSDRRTIVEAVRSPAGVDRRAASATLDTLRDVRKRLRSPALGVGARTVVVPLPSDLEDRVAAGLTSDRPVWELPRQEAHRLVADVRAWLHAQPVTPDAVCVADGRVRPFVWRLLAAHRSAVRVLSKEELHVRVVSEEKLS
jgi:tetratricopeptide (TPR) repeat protein